MENFVGSIHSRMEKFQFENGVDVRGGLATGDDYHWCHSQLGLRIDSMKEYQTNWMCINTTINV